MTAKEIIKRLKADGWRLVRSVGSHKQFAHPTKPGIVTIAMHSGDIHPKTVTSIEQQSGLNLKKR